MRIDMEQNNLRILRIRSLAQSLMILLGVILVQIFGAILWTAVSILCHITMEDSTRLMYMSFISALLTSIWCGCLYYRSTWRIRPFAYRQICSVKTVVSILGLGMGGCITVALLLSFLQSIFPSLFDGYVKTMDQFGQGEVVITLLYTIGIGPVAEELVFRGAILDRLRLAYPFWAANLLQAALFGLYHMNLIQGIYAFLWGILLGLLYQATGSILAGILAHIIFNTTNYLLGWLFPAETAVSILLYIGIFLFGVIFFGVGLWYTIQSCTTLEKGRLSKN